MALIREMPVETSADCSTEFDVEYRDDGLVVLLSGRTIEFSLERDRRLATLVEDTQQVDASPEDIPDIVVEHVLTAGYRLLGPSGEREEDGEHVLWVGDSR